jgi:hypothetical protein
VSVTSAQISSGQLTLTLSNGSQINAGSVTGSTGSPSGPSVVDAQGNPIGPFSDFDINGAGPEVWISSLGLFVNFGNHAYNGLVATLSSVPTALWSTASDCSILYAGQVSGTQTKPPDYASLFSHAWQLDGSTPIKLVTAGLALPGPVNMQYSFTNGQCSSVNVYLINPQPITIQPITLPFQYPVYLPLQIQ